MRVIRDGRHDRPIDVARPIRRFAWLVPDLRRKAGQPFFEVPVIVIDIANIAILVHDQPLIVLIPATSVFFPPFSFLSCLPPPSRLVAVGLADGFDVSQNQPVAAHQMTADLFGCLAFFEALHRGFQRADGVGDFLMLGFEHPQPLGGLFHDPEQHGPGRSRVNWRDRLMILLIKLGLVALELFFGDLVPELMEGVLMSRLEGVACQEHQGDFAFGDRLDWLAAHQPDGLDLVVRLPGPRARFESLF